MANVLIEESILQEWANTIREKQAITDKMVPSVLLEKTKELGTGGGNEVLVEVLKEKTYTGFTENTVGDYQLDLVSDIDFKSELNLIAGEKYVIVWDGEEYRLTATEGLANCIDFALDEFVEDGFPFYIGYIYDYSEEGYDVLEIKTTDDGNSHTFGIYKITDGVSYKAVVFGKQDVEDFAFDSDYGIYKATKNPYWFLLQVGESYIVNWEGVEYKCIAQLIDMGNYTAVCIGNCSPVGGVGNDEPFIITYIEAYSINTFFALTTESKHNVAVYKETKVNVPHELVKYVTFMSWDGLTELYKKPTISGDDCVNVYSKGLISKPTRESTNTTNYTYSGWSLTAGGSADSSALKNVTEDRVVYAAFTESVRYYTVNFYTEVGVLHETVQVTYGGTATPSTNPEKSGYIFDSWSPSNENITADTDCYAVWQEGLDFASSPWADIARVCEAGDASKYFKIGDVRDVAWTNRDGTTITTQFQIVGIDHDDLANGLGKAGLSIMSVPSINPGNYIVSNNPTTPSRVASGSVSTVNAWSTCPARTEITDGFYPKLPSDLKVHIKEVTKISTKDTGTMTTHNYVSDESADKVWIPSITEMVGINCAYAKIPHGTQYEYFKDTNSRIKYEQGTDGTVGTTAVEYSTRSMSGYAGGKTYSIKNNGSYNNQKDSTNWKFPIGFCI